MDSCSDASTIAAAPEVASESFQLKSVGDWSQCLFYVPINERQRPVLNRLLDGFEGKLTTSKYAKLAMCSQDTAIRDI